MMQLGSVYVLPPSNCGMKMDEYSSQKPLEGRRTLGSKHTSSE